MSLLYSFTVGLIVAVTSIKCRTCPREEFECDNGTCNPNSWFCDGAEDCSDGTDEPTYATSDDGNITLCRGTSVYRAPLCVLPLDLEQDRDILCRDDRNCPEEMFECDNGTRCIHHDLFCNGYQHCRDGSDEPYAASYHDNGMMCRKRSDFARLCILPHELQQEKQLLCRDKIRCSQEEFECHDRSRTCIPASSFCDGLKDCGDESDELYPASYQYNGTLCRRSGNVFTSGILCILPLELQHKKGSLCRDEIRCSQEEFECHDRSRKCILASSFCDGLPDCSDASDENTSLPAANSAYQTCFGYDPLQSGWKPCQLREKDVCDGKPICGEGVDEGLCGEREEDHISNVSFRCFGNSAFIVAVTKVCDGKFDCNDMTDECLCQSTEHPKICERMAWDGQEPYLQCNESINSNRANLIATSMCDMNSDCNFIGKEKHCLDVSTVGCGRTSPDGGERGCAYMTSDDSSSFATCLGSDLHCKVFLDKRQLSHTNSTSLRPWITCSIEFRSIGHCDIKYNCTNVLDQKKSTRECKIPDTNDKSYDVPCNCSYYICDEKYIHGKAVCDGFKDCNSGIDECQPGCILSAFSDETSMIANKGVVAFVWIFSVFAIIGCTAVVAVTFRDIVTSAGSHSDSPHSKINKLLIMSLSISDFLVAIYTLSICIKAIEVEGNYCYADISWRTSTTCSILGALLIIGSEQSVLTMVLITKFRLNAVMRPLSIPKPKRAIIAVVATWSISIIIGVIPLMPSLEDYFLKDVSFNDTAIFKTKVNQNDKKHLINWLGLLNKDMIQEHDDSTEWGKLRRLISHINKYSPITATYEFGYYSSHTVCLPTFFPDRNKDGSWAYSFILLMLNFLAFVFMFISYIVLYRKATNRKIAQSSTARDKLEEKNAAMQRKLTRILATDFFCWMPVCIMGFLQLTGINIPSDAYLPTGLLIIPINSALNPFLYSDVPDRIMSLKRRFLTWLAESLRQWRFLIRNTSGPSRSFEPDVIEVNRGDVINMD